MKISVGRRIWNAFYPVLGPVILVAMFVLFLLSAADIEPSRRRLETLSVFQPHHIFEHPTPTKPPVPWAAAKMQGQTPPPTATPRR